MQDQTASRTALATAFLRAAHQILDNPPLLLSDPGALLLLGPRAAGTINADLSRYQSQAGKALRTHVVLRSRFAEDRLQESVARGVTRYILVGAGFDTFAWRQPSWARGLQIVEVDHPATQAAKRERIAKAGLAESENLLFAPVDFEREDLDGLLACCGVNRTEPVFFSWLGVTVYLEEGAIDATLRAIAAFAPGTRVVLTFRQPGGEHSAPLAERASELGEPFVTLFTPEEMGAKLLRSGFRNIDFLTPERARRLYFTPPRNDLPVPKRTSILCAAR